MADPHFLPDEIDGWPDGPLWKAHLEQLVREKPLFEEILQTLGQRECTPDELVADLKLRCDTFIKWDGEKWRSQVARYLKVLSRLRRVVRWGPVYKLIPGPKSMSAVGKPGRGSAPTGAPSRDEQVLIDLLRFERRLRAYIERRLRQHYGESWWEEGIPNSVREIAARNRSGKPPEEQGPDSRNVKFLEWGDYSAIILNKRNWKNVFEGDFRDKERATVYLKDLTDSRNAIVHARESDPALTSAIPLFIKRLDEIIGPSSGGT